MFRITLLLICLLLWSGMATSDNYLPRKNPFGQPEELKQKKPALQRYQGRIVEPPPQLPELKLTATLISVTEPLVIVNDKLLRVGDEIEGMRLGLVDEGRAVFYFKGKAYEFTLDEGQESQTR